MGDLLFYGRENAEARGEFYAYERYTGVPEAANDPFALFLDEQAAFRGLYLDAEAETGYIRDRNVFGEPITHRRYDERVGALSERRAILSYCLIAYSPWEGLRVAITGTKGRIEMDIAENIIHLLGDEQVTAPAPAKAPSRARRMRVYPDVSARPYDVDVPVRRRRAWRR